MFKERVFQKRLTIQNFRSIESSDLSQAGKNKKGKLIKKDAGLLAQVFYSPRGFCCELDQLSPIDVWDSEQYCRIEGISDKTPEGDLLDHTFDTMLAAMHFITRRLKKLGWEPLDTWCDGLRSES